MAIKQKRRSTKIGLCREDKIMYAVVNSIMILVLIAVLYPLIYVVSCSFSGGEAVTSGQIILLPVDFSLEGYEMVFRYKQVWVGYGNSVIYTVVGTGLNILLTTLTAYPLSRKKLHFKKLYVAFFMITMFFSGGIIPAYILKVKLGLNGTRWAIILSGALSVYNMIIMRTFFQNNIPNDLLEAAKIDGITDTGYLLRIVIPLSKAIFSVITLYYAVGHWNSYFNAMMYLRDQNLFPLQLVLRSILNVSKFDLTDIDDPEVLARMVGLADVMKHSLIVISSVPVLVAYPFVQKFFQKGVMIGSVKG